MVKKIYPLFYLVLSISVLYFIFNPGYVILLDMPFSHNFINIRTSELFYGFAQPEYGGFLVFLSFTKLLTFIAGVQFVEKLILLFTLCISGIAGHSLINSKSQIPCYFAGIIYMLNPFVYVRFLAGQWMFLLGYAVLPFAIKSFINFLNEQKKYNMIEAIFLLTLVGIFNIHMLLLSLIIIFILLIFKLSQKQDFKLIKNFFVLIIFVLLLSSYWLLPLLTAKNKLLDNISQSDVYSFSPTTASFNAVFTISSMYGFWRDGYIYAKDFLPIWEVLFSFILFLSVYGFISYYKDKEIGVYIKSFGVIAIVGLILAAGVWSPLSGNFLWLFNHTPLKGMRDSHKFVTLLVLAYSYLGALGVKNLSEGIRIEERRNRYFLFAFISLALVTPFIYSFTFFNGFAGQIKPIDYPTDWYEVNQFLNNDTQDFKVLFLPWHMYMNFHWILNKDKRIANPAQYFFDKGVISGKNIEIGEIYNQVNSSDQRYIDFLLKEKQNITNFGELIVPLNIKYVLLVKEVDYKGYSFLFNQSDLKLVKETENFYVFENKHEVSKIYEVDGITYIKDWRELLERSKDEDITQRVYFIGDSLLNAQENLERKVLKYDKKSQGKYELTENISKKYLIFTEPYSDSWELDGKKPLMAYGVVNVYEVNKTNSKEIKYWRFYGIYLPSYIISLLAFIVLVAIYLDLDRKIITQKN
ncbi:MAG: alpha-(1-_3)-arabinofuranosyltransferase family protein [Candidatus Methanoperedens sp.]|nr:alpha-(1->3)-arabinofuranosyltransferase family protein [Candidatus Methanoperedens sp.]